MRDKLWAGTGNTSTDPVFTDPVGRDGVPGTLDDDFCLQQGSPCIDAANNAVVSVDEFDLEDDGNTSEPLPFDLDGLPRFKDDPLSSDTGVGPPPFVDMGAYEYQRGCLKNVDCDDGVSCTVDTCDEENDSCTFTATDDLCHDGSFCNGNESCDSLDGCFGSEPPCNESPWYEHIDRCGPICDEIDVDGDGDLDFVDLANFMNCWTGPMD